MEAHNIALKAGYVPIRAQVCDNLRAQADPGPRNVKKYGPAPKPLGANPHAELNIQGVQAKLMESSLPDVPKMQAETSVRPFHHIFSRQLAGNRERYSLLQFKEIGESQLRSYYRKKVLCQGSGGPFGVTQQKLKGWAKPPKRVSK